MAARRKSAVKVPPKLAEPQFFLLESRVVSANYTCSLRPEEAPKGRYEMSSEAEALLLESEDPERPEQLVLLTLRLSMNGYRLILVDGKQKKDKNSFSISLVTEAKFRVAEGALPKGTDLPDLQASKLICQAHPLAVLRLRQITEEMGFKGVRPPLGLRPDAKPMLKAEVPKVLERVVV